MVTGGTHTGESTQCSEHQQSPIWFIVQVLPCYPTCEVDVFALTMCNGGVNSRLLNLQEESTRETPCSLLAGFLIDHNAMHCTRLVGFAVTEYFSSISPNIQVLYVCVNSYKHCKKSLNSKCKYSLTKQSQLCLEFGSLHQRFAQLSSRWICCFLLLEAGIVMSNNNFPRSTMNFDSSWSGTSSK